MTPVTATIVHNDDDLLDPSHRRVRLSLVERDGRYVWIGPDGDTAADGATAEEALDALRWVYGIPGWGLEIG